MTGFKYWLNEMEENKMAFERLRIGMWLAKEKVVDTVRYAPMEISDMFESTVFSGKIKKEALIKHDAKLKEYNDIYKEMIRICNELYLQRTSVIELISFIEKVLNSIANSPKEFDVRMGKIEVELQSFKETEDYAKQTYQKVEKAQKELLSGVATGVSIATMAPSALMSLATTFGTASTGTAISALSGAAAQKAAVAWVGRTFAGVAVKSGAGMLAGQAFLALAGPVGWGITAATASFSILKLVETNKKVAEQAMEETKEIVKATNLLKKTNEKIVSLLRMTRKTYYDMLKQRGTIRKYMNADFMELQEDERMFLATLVNNTLSLAALLNKSVE